MTSRRFIYYIIAAFIAGNLLLIFLQYSSSRNINDLIGGNEQLLGEFNFSDQLRQLEKNLVAVESSIRGMVATGDSSHIARFTDQVDSINSALGRLQKINSLDSSVGYIEVLDQLVQEKIRFSRQVIDTFYLSGKEAAERMLSLEKSRDLTENITLISHKIDSSRQDLLTGLTASLDKSGKQAQRWGTILIMVVLISGAGLFWFIIDKIRQQNQLIRQLDRSEKQVREAARVKENFMANMSHEIRTPLNAILGFTRLLLRKPLDDDSRSFAVSIRQSGDNLLTIVNDILDLSKIEAGMMRIEAAPFRVREVLAVVEKLFEVKAKEKNLRWEMLVDDSVPEILEGDATRLTQVLVNLAGNAVKFTEKGTVAIRASAAPASAGNILVSFTVSDTGIGIAEDKLPGIFERFEQAEESITRKYGGTGLGLAISRELVLLQQGSISVESKPGEGACFRFSIPYKISEELAGQVNTAPVKASQSYARPASVLVAEDNQLNQSLVSHLLTEWGLSFEIVANGREAIELLCRRSFDLVLMDLQMPEVDGYSATRYIRQELQMNVPIVAMTAHALPAEKEKCLRQGMNDYISKPLREELLSSIIDRWTNNTRHMTDRQEEQTGGDGYRYINLGYMREISNGDASFEHTVTGQFIEMLPDDLQALEKAFDQKDMVTIAAIAHNMSTSIAVMGLTAQLQPYLDLLQQPGTGIDLAREQIDHVKSICQAALEEARSFLSSLR